MENHIIFPAKNNSSALEWYYNNNLNNYDEGVNHDGDDNATDVVVAAAAAKDYIEPYWSLPHHIEPHKKKKGRHHIFGISYNQLMREILEPLMFHLNEEMTKRENSSFTTTPASYQDNNQQPIIAVSIPEGPYLPISILAVHLLNALSDHVWRNNIVDSSKKDDYIISKPIILPLDPQEGIDRLKHMVKDAKPSIILYVGNSTIGHQKNLEKVINELEIELESDDNEMIIPTLLDIHELLEIKMMTQTSSSKLMNDTATKTPPEIPNNIRKLESNNRISHVVYTSGTTGVPKGTISSMNSLTNYISAKNKSHYITTTSRVFLASSLSFDPCLSDIIATFYSGGCLCLCKKEEMKMNFGLVLQALHVSHVLCTPSLWNSVCLSQRQEQRQQIDGISSINYQDQRSECNDAFECLQVVALGGEPMSGRIKGRWASSKVSIRNDENDDSSDSVDDEVGTKSTLRVRLLSTYGVTEACIYQTIGEVFVEDEICNNMGYDVGLPMEGTSVIICDESDQDNLNELNTPAAKGEIVLSGSQVDEFSGYLNLPELTKRKFIQNGDKYYYRTGDRGLIDPTSGRLRITGRIHGEEGMVKVNGVRVELSEIEHAILDKESFSSTQLSSSLVLGCMVALNTLKNDDDRKVLVAYCVLSDECLNELGIEDFMEDDIGLICSPGPLLTILKTRCEGIVRIECVPSTFVLIPRIPLTRTGKRNKKALPSLDCCTLIDAFIDGGRSPVRLDQHGRCGKVVYNTLIECLNLQPSQQELVTTKVNFAMIGGDSLAATLVVRTLYALHHKVNNSRYLGGNFGTFDGTFSVSNLLTTTTLGQYVDLLDSKGVMVNKTIEDGVNVESQIPAATDHRNIQETNDAILYDHLIESITFGYYTIAIGLLAVGANPNFKDHGNRLGKLKNGRKEQKKLLCSNPLHLACARGHYILVSALLNSECKCKSPDASGQYPLHLACSGVGDMNKMHANAEDKNRLECVRLLLEVGKVPLSMKNGSKQTVLHCAARAGHCRTLSYLLDAWGADTTIKANKLWGSKFDWQDRWFRTPVHWAVLNSRVSALQILMKYCSATPPIPKRSQNRSSVAIESPLEICERLHDINSDLGKQMKDILLLSSKERCA